MKNQHRAARSHKIRKRLPYHNYLVQPYHLVELHLESAGATVAAIPPGRERLGAHLVSAAAAAVLVAAAAVSARRQARAHWWREHL